MEWAPDLESQEFEEFMISRRFNATEEEEVMRLKPELKLMRALVMAQEALLKVGERRGGGGGEERQRVQEVDDVEMNKHRRNVKWRERRRLGKLKALRQKQEKEKEEEEEEEEEGADGKKAGTGVELA